MAELVFLKGDEEAVRLPLKRGETTIGRGADCEITLEGSEVSRLHTIIRYRDGFYHVEDKSKNGTRINGELTEKKQLASEDLIVIGDWRLKFVGDTPSAREGTVTVTTAQPTVTRKDGKQELAGMIAVSQKMKDLFSLIEKVAPSSASILILGETGTGKELIANALHQLSKRVMLPFVPVNCAAISPNLVESELFGHEKGAFTGAIQIHQGAFEQAGGGTLFLDEIGELSLDLQSKLLRTLEVQKIKRVGSQQETSIKCRIVAATHKNLVRAVKEKEFREDLYYRLFVVPIETPPLRQRREDIPPLVEHFLREMKPEHPPKLARKAMEKLEGHLWPGNIRELKNVILRATLLSGDDEIDADRIVFLPLSFSGSDGDTKEPQTIAEMEKEMILQKLKNNNWNKAAAARELGLATSTIFKKIKEYELKKEE